MQILVTGGAGYIGAHVAKELHSAGHLPIVLDSLFRGHRDFVRWGPLLEMDLSSLARNPKILRKYSIDAVIHLAALAYVDESLVNPSEYFANNITNTHTLLDAMRAAGVDKIIFSSTCATYGNPTSVPISEDHQQHPVNPYGESKRTAERMVQWYENAYGLKWFTLRYFNAAGADESGDIGEAHDPETHLVPRAIAAAMGAISHLDVYGTDYDTPDGTAVRDFVHVTDLARAHVAALTKLVEGTPSQALNLGTGRGYSVKEVLAEVEAVSGRRVPAVMKPRRAGDPGTLVADASRAIGVLGWRPQYSSLRNIVETACRWHLKTQPVGPQASYSHIGPA